MPIFKRRIFTRKVIYGLFQLNVWTFQKCKNNARACALRGCLGVSRPFVSDTSPKFIDREGLERRRTGTKQNKTDLTNLRFLNFEKGEACQSILIMLRGKIGLCKPEVKKIGCVWSFLLLEEFKIYLPWNIS